LALYCTVPVPGVKVPPVLVVVPPITRVLELPRRAPVVRVQDPEKVWVSPAPRSNVPPDPFNVKPAPPTFPVNIAVPPVLIIETSPVVLNPPMFWVAVVPPKLTGAVPASHAVALLLMKSPSNVIALPAVTSFAPDIIFNGTLVLLPSCLAPLRVIVPVPLITTPPSAVNGVGHSPDTTVRLLTPALYCRVALVPNVNIPIKLLVYVPFSMERVSFTVTPPVPPGKDFIPVPDRISLL